MKVVPGFFNAVVGDARLGEVVGANFFRSGSGAHGIATFFGEFT